MKEHAIGIIDSGIGGYSVAKAIRTRLPQEHILYLGDGANAPYGNRTAPELTQLAQYMVHFTNQQKVKLLLVACNTISCLAPTYSQEIACPVLFVVQSGASGVADSTYDKIGVVSTNFTHEKGMYTQSIHNLSPTKEVYSAGSTHLVRLIEQYHGDTPTEQEMETEIRSVLAPLVKEGIEVCVLGCTHYPLALSQFQHCYPDLLFSDPAEEMAREAEQFLKSHHLLRESSTPQSGELTVYTTGEPHLQEAHLKRVGLSTRKAIAHLPPLELP